MHGPCVHGKPSDHLVVMVEVPGHNARSLRFSLTVPIITQGLGVAMPLWFGQAIPAALDAVYSLPKARLTPINTANALVNS